jgi:tRNA/rRNA methyltransferase
MQRSPVPGCGPRVVLVRPRGGLNVGSVARVTKNLAGGELCIVAGEYDAAQAKLLAVHAEDVLAARREAATLEEALAGAGIVVGTTARSGAYRDRTRDVRELAGEIARACVAAQSHDGLPPALVFGPEDTGLTNEDIARCHELVYIPTGPDYSSLNLSHAVAITLYEVLRARTGIAERAEERPRAWGVADATMLEAALVDLERGLRAIGFFEEATAAHMMQSIRAMFGRARMDERDVRILRGIAGQIDWFAGEGHRVLAAKRRGDDPHER